MAMSAVNSLHIPPSTDGLRQGIGLAVAVHVGLLIALSLGVSWRQHEVQPVSAELWSALPQAAAMAGGAVTPPPPPPAPVEKIVQPPVRPAPPPPEPRHEADIATHKAPKPKPEPVKPVPEPKKVETRKPEPVKPDPKQEAKEREKERRDKAAAAAAEVAEAKAAADRRKAALAAMQAKIDQLAGPEGPGTASGSRGGTARSGGAPVATGPSPGYDGRIRARILPNIVYTGHARGNPTAEVEVSLAPDGTILKSRLLKGSGIEDWDQAVLRAIERTGTLPVDTDGRIPSKMVLSFDPNKR